MIWTCSASGGMPILFDGVYAPSTLGTLLREFSFGHARQLESVLRQHLGALAERTELLVGIQEQAFIDIDSLLRPVYGHAKQGASYGHTKIAGKQVLRKGLSPLATTISTEHSAPVLAGMRLRAGKTGSGKGAGRMVAQAIATARAAGATGKILVRGDSAYCNRAVVRACRRCVRATIGAGVARDSFAPMAPCGKRETDRSAQDQSCQASVTGGLRPRCSYAAVVAIRPRGPRLIRPARMRKGSIIPTTVGMSTPMLLARLARPTGPPM